MTVSGLALAISPMRVISSERYWFQSSMIDPLWVSE
ncbi:Uncharacterised protein [Bordetella pertussis]|nr:Uncharacterised protein [Bordetella pertussis]CFP66416.1 Uncharacterised protein [Bordetella pertussis]